MDGYRCTFDSLASYAITTVQSFVGTPGQEGGYINTYRHSESSHADTAGATAGVYIGTSGWSYPHWKDNFYLGVRRDQWLHHYCRLFHSVEINASFYRHPSIRSLKDWHDITPDDFRFALKGHRFITHNKKLRDSYSAIRRERDHMAALGEKLKVLLWQLPSTLRKNTDRLSRFFIALKQWPNVRHVIEFRHPSWFCNEVMDILLHHDISNCISDAADWPAWPEVTGNTVYIRLHGHTRTYASTYTHGELEAWAQRIRQWHALGLTVYIYFDNDAEGAAPHDALYLQTLLGADAPC